MLEITKLNVNQAEVISLQPKRGRQMCDMPVPLLVLSDTRKNANGDDIWPHLVEVLRKIKQIFQLQNAIDTKMVLEEPIMVL